MQTCPVCHATVPGSLVDHGISDHGYVRPPLIVGICGLLGLAAALCLYQGLRPLPDLFDLLGDGEFGRAIAAYLLLFVLVIAGYGAALGFIARLIWLGDRTARALVFVACGPLALAGLVADDSNGQVRIVALIALAAMAALSLVPEVRDWFTGPFAAQLGQPVTVVVARACFAWSGFLAGVATLVYLIVLTIDSGKILELLLYGAAAGLLGYSFNEVVRGDPRTRVLASAGAGAILLATIVSGDTAFGGLAIVGPALIALGLLWLAPDSNAFFGTAPVGSGGAPFDHTPPGQWGAPQAPAAAWAPPGSTPSASAPWDPPGAVARASDWGVPSPADSGWGPSDPPGASLLDLSAPFEHERVELPSPSGQPSAAPAGPTTPTPPNLPRPAAPTPSAPRSESVTLSGFTGISAPRVQLILAASGATPEANDADTSWFAVPGASVIVRAESETRVWVEAADAERVNRVGRTVQSALGEEDPGFRLGRATEQAPSPERPGARRSAEASWYPDPFQASGLRYWDGRGWGAQTTPS